MQSMTRALGLLTVVVALSGAPPEQAPPPPGDAAIHAWLDRAASSIEAQFPNDVASADDWRAKRPGYKAEYFDMLGLDPLPPRGPLKATETGRVEGDGFVVENLHYQSVPGLYVTANLYRPAAQVSGERLPAVLYVCGHSRNGRDGGKTMFQSHGAWFARHGYVCLIVDTSELGEVNCTHHGTYSEGRWWWLSRGHTPAGIECWNGIRGLDYLSGRPDVDPERLAVTGISGGGAATFWIAAADERVKVAVPVSGMADLNSYVNDHVVNGHCDCMFLHNAYQWPWTRIAGMIAPRPLLFVNSDADPIFPMNANDRVIARLERLYSKFGASDQVDAVVSVGGHAYRADLRQAIYRFINTHLKGDPAKVEDSEVDLVAESGRGRKFPIESSKLRVFKTDADIPADQINTTIDQHFVPLAKVELPPKADSPEKAQKDFATWKDGLLAGLRRRPFRAFPERVAPAKPGENGRLETEPGIEVALTKLPADDQGPLVVLEVSLDDGDPAEPLIATGAAKARGAYRLQPRGVGPGQWVRKNPPNTVERSLVLVGRTADDGRVWDLASTARYLEMKHGPDTTIRVLGRGKAGVLAAYAALLEPSIDEVVLVDPPGSHMDANSPALLNVLRVLDVPEAIGLIAPRRVIIRGGPDALRERVRAIFDRASLGDRLETTP